MLADNKLLSTKYFAASGFRYTTFLQNTLTEHDKHVPNNSKAQNLTKFFPAAIYAQKTYRNILQEVSKQLRSSLSWWQRAHGSLSHVYNAVGHRVSSAQEWDKQGARHPLSKNLLHYIALEDTYCLAHYSQALLFFDLIDHQSALPEVINFWSDKNSQRLIAERLKKLQPPLAHIQFFAGALETVLVSVAHQALPIFMQASLMAGQGMYVQWISSRQQEKMQVLTAQQATISKNYQEYLTQLQQERKNITNSIVTNFTSAQENLTAEL